MKAQATLEMLFMFLVTMTAIMFIFYPIAKAHHDFGEQADFIEKKQELEDYLVGLQVYCNGGAGTSVSSSTSSIGCSIFPEYGKITFRCGQQEQEFPGFFMGCVKTNEKRPV